MSEHHPVIVWFRNDLRAHDHPALVAAAQTGRPIIPIFILDEDARALGGASRWWLHHSLKSLEKSLGGLGATLLLHRGNSHEILQQLTLHTQATAIYYNKSADPSGVDQENLVAAWAHHQNISVHPCAPSLLIEPWAMTNKSGDPYRVFTPFWKAFLAQGRVAEPLPAPKSLRGFRPPAGVGEPLESWDLLPTHPNWAQEFGLWTPGEAGARERLQQFFTSGLADYHNHRNRPDLDGTSRLSPHLRWGEISPRQIWFSTQKYAASQGLGYDPLKFGSTGPEAFLRELGWREFSYNLLYHFPTLPSLPLQPAFARFPWRQDPEALQRWQHGLTGYPIVDAGMRQLWRIGWMHNRVRMIVGSFLVKDLQLPWTLGEDWFWDTLVDADPASNAASWQWVAGCGADAAPYFRVFNPVLQGQKFDPNGDYVRLWVPELARVPTMYLHAPWEAPASVLRQAGVELGTTYPHPIVDHAHARDVALALYASLKS
jgi:deoxyribodipyrimidine photo-lyase